MWLAVCIFWLLLVSSSNMQHHSRIVVEQYLEVKWKKRKQEQAFFHKGCGKHGDNSEDLLSK